MNRRIITKFVLIAFVSLGLIIFSMLQPTQSQIDSSLNSLSLHHVALSVHNLEETIQWYQDKLGFRATLRRELPQFSTQQAFLELNGFRIEFFERENSDRTQPSPANVPDDLLVQGYKHIAFAVNDIDAVAAELKQRSVEVVLAPVVDEEIRLKVCFVKDNNGNLIELVQELNTNKPKN
jgi:methylmalonyl-CoA/ethylmalonyl-CoA epimerase